MPRKRLGCSYVPEFIFHECCVLHDVSYDMLRERLLAFDHPALVELKRKTCDTIYLSHMLRIVAAHGKHKYFYTTVAYLYYYGVRAFGGFALR